MKISTQQFILFGTDRSVRSFSHSPSIYLSIYHFFSPSPRLSCATRSGSFFWQSARAFGAPLRFNTESLNSTNLSSVNDDDLLFDWISKWFRKNDSKICGNVNMMSNANRHLSTNNCYGGKSSGSRWARKWMMRESWRAETKWRWRWSERQSALPLEHGISNQEFRFEKRSREGEGNEIVLFSQIQRKINHSFCLFSLFTFEHIRRAFDDSVEIPSNFHTFQSNLMFCSIPKGLHRMLVTIFHFLPSFPFSIISLFSLRSIQYNLDIVWCAHLNFFLSFQQKK